ncbi:hypothetical protein EPI10_032314 [Gossypium australe]|uniref:Uncharacterized protein n=1 Tax=Gossypium australe TaxID=47621 RepID=A0A5B6X4C4_9ROSI|nr:hypothetical protein EPI10_032314 [Gossypium australe]
MVYPYGFKSKLFITVTRTKPTKSAGVFNLDAVTMLSTQVEMINKKLDSLCSLQEHPVIQCDASGIGES